MEANYTPVYDNNGTPIEITLDAMEAANESVALLKQFRVAIRANSQQGYRLLGDASYFAFVKNSLNNMEDVRLLDAKRRWGERILRDTDYLDQMAKLAIKECVGGAASIVNGQQVITALIPAQVIDGVLQPIAESIIVNAVASLSNDNTLIRILISRGEL